MNQSVHNSLLSNLKTCKDILKKKSLIYIAAALVSAGIFSGMTVSAAGNSTWNYTSSRNEDGNICITFDEIELILPADWSGKCRMRSNENSVTFYHIRSRELYTQQYGEECGGTLFSLNCSDDYDYLDEPSYETIGTGKKGTYYFSFPTDVQGYYEDEAVIAEYSALSNQVDWITQNVRLLTADPTASAMKGDYIFPQSSTTYLTDKDIEGYSYDDLQMAINEIYARHHRKFSTPSVIDYFASKSWYQGLIEPNEFDTAVFSQIEWANINLMLKKMEQIASSNSH